MPRPSAGNSIPAPARKELNRYTHPGFRDGRRRPAGDDAAFTRRARFTPVSRQFADFYELAALDALYWMRLTVNGRPAKFDEISRTNRRLVPYYS